MLDVASTSAPYTAIIPCACINTPNLWMATAVGFCRSHSFHWTGLHFWEASHLVLCALGQ